MATLGNLFDQIVHSEKKAEERKRIIRQAKAETIQCVERVQKRKEEMVNLQQVFSRKVSDLNELRLQLKWTQSRLEILKNHRSRMKSQLQESKESMHSLIMQTEKDTDNFFRCVDHFGDGYDFISGGEEKRQKSAIHETKQVEKYIEELRQEIGSFEDMLKETDKLRKKAELTENSIISRAQEKEDLEKNIKLKDIHIIKLETVREEVDCLPNTGEDFIKQKRELQTGRETEKNFELECSALQDHLRDLQQQHWQRSLQQKRDIQSQHRASLSRFQQQQQLYDAKQIKQTNAPCLKDGSSSSSLVISPNETKSQVHVHTIPGNDFEGNVADKPVQQIKDGVITSTISYQQSNENLLLDRKSDIYQEFNESMFESDDAMDED